MPSNPKTPAIAVDEYAEQEEIAARSAARLDRADRGLDHSKLRVANGYKADADAHAEVKLLLQHARAEVESFNLAGTVDRAPKQVLDALLEVVRLQGHAIQKIAGDVYMH